MEGEMVPPKLTVADKRLGITYCPGGHEMNGFVTDSPGYSCDNCAALSSNRTELPLGSVLWGCTECNYDVCEQCIGRLRFEYNKYQTNRDAGEVRGAPIDAIAKTTADKF